MMKRPAPDRCLAGELGAAGVPIFMFQEGRDSAVRRLFRLLALKSGGRILNLTLTRSICSPNSLVPWRALP